MAKKAYPKLKNAPLQEVIFDLKWALDIDEDGNEYDKLFPLKQGIFANEVKKKYPTYVQRLPPILPQQVLNHKPIHQFRKTENQFPLLQIGPGVFSANDSHPTYIWKSFNQVIQYGLEKLQISYDNEIPPIKEVSLRYINAIVLPSEAINNVVEYIGKNLNVEVSCKFLLNEKEPNAQNITINQMFDVGNGIELHIQIFTAQGAEGKEMVLVWHIIVLQKGNVPFDELSVWAENAHTYANEVFHNMISHDFHTGFSV